MLAPAKAASAEWFHQRVEWHAGKEALRWETQLPSPNGKEHYRLALIPLWYVEGGIYEMAIFISRRSLHSIEGVNDLDFNLLGKFEDEKPHPYLISVEDLENGIDKSPFGAIRVFKVDKGKLTVKVVNWHIGRGSGECDSCPRIEDLTIDLLFQK